MDSILDQWVREGDQQRAQRQRIADRYLWLVDLSEFRREFLNALPQCSEDDLPDDLVGTERHVLVVEAFMHFAESVRGHLFRGDPDSDRLRKLCDLDDCQSSDERRMARQLFRQSSEGDREALLDAIGRLGQARSLHQYDTWREVKFIAAEIIDPAEVATLAASVSEAKAWDLVPVALRLPTVNPPAPVAALPASPRTAGKAATSRTPKQGKGKRIDEQMMTTLRDEPKMVEGWSVRQWAAHFRCSTSTVGGTKTWTLIMESREQAKRDRIANRSYQG